MSVAQVLLLEHLLWLDQGAQAETDLLLGHTHALKKGLTENADCVRLQDFLQGVRVLQFGLLNRLREMNRIELSEVAQQVLVNDLIADDSARV